MKSRDGFVAARQSSWQQLDRLLMRDRLSGSELSQLSALYREVCSDTMTARAAHYGTDLTSHLDELAARGHAALYGHERKDWQIGFDLLVRDFPRRLRENHGFIAAAAALFVVPLLLGLVATLHAPRFAEAVLPAEQLQGMAEAYSQSVSEGRDPGTNAFMAGFYVHNNISIAFRCFATGILFGLGSAFFLAYNGLITGTVVGHVIATGHGKNILTFVAGHSSFELGAVIIAGAAGLRLGYSLIATGGYTRSASLKQAAQLTVPLIVGVVGMLSLAALTEAFWSPSRAPYPVKWVVAALNLILVIVFWSTASRPKRSASR